MEDDREPWWAEDPELLAIRRRVLEEFECVQREPIESDQPDPVVDDMLSGASWRELGMRATTLRAPAPGTPRRSERPARLASHGARSAGCSVFRSNSCTADSADR